MFKGRLVLNRNSEWIPKLFHEFHGSAMGGHSGVQKTYQRMARELFWTGMKGDIARMVAQCDVCQRQKYSTLAPSGLLQPLELPNKVWSEVTMDFIGGLPKSEGFSVIFVVVDRLSKYAHFVPLKHPYTALTVAGVFLREVVRLHGVPESIVSDRDRVFLSLFWRELFRLQGTKLKRSTTYHPQTDGQTEVVNRCLETYLRCLVADSPRNGLNGCRGRSFGTILPFTRPPILLLFGCSMDGIRPIWFIMAVNALRWDRWKNTWKNET